MTSEPTTRGRSPLPRLVVITDWAIPELRGKLEAVARLGARVAFQHRAPTMAVRDFLEQARWLRALCDRTGALLMVNGRLEVALLVGAGLHLPEDSADVADCRRLLPHAPLSVAIHERTSPRRAAGADFAIVSPVFPPGSKPTDTRAPLGASGFFELARRLPCPAFALGGVSPVNAPSLRGAAGLCAISAVLKADDPARAAERLLESS